ncbi:MAG: hypothetical protein JRI69_12040 [Deltaproteobacteria bacterium]|nr:hypothetical protein [Deltaproteobacteria bacterium]MBW2089636.1 hypothetical protein [Deltaproteobacteria bacterium]
MDIEEILNEETKLCPECAETIKLKAKKCRFCGEKFDPEKLRIEIETRRAELVKDKEGKVRCPKCGSWDVYKTYLEDGSYENYCPNCNQSLKSIVDKKDKSENTKESKIGYVAKFIIIILIGLLPIIFMINNEETVKHGRKWYEGGTLHNSTMKEWQRASYSNRLASCADFVVATSEWREIAKRDGVNAIKPQAMGLERCISEAAQGADSLNLKVKEVAAMCTVLMRHQ